MNYFETYKSLKDKINYDEDHIILDSGTVVNNFTFISKNLDILSGEDEYFCPAHQFKSTDENAHHNDLGMANSILDIHDSQIKENSEFRYHVFSPFNVTKSKNIVLLFHGFNEKSWAKYFPWAKQIVKQTGKSVVLFPIAFHMNRAPQAWSDPRQMYQVSELRRKKFPDIISSTLSNVAISTRLHAKPQRFVWSGLQTFYDVIQFIRQIKSGNHPVIDTEATIDIFAYSIGSLLAEILIMTNPDGYFTDSKVCFFCGGAVFNRLSPVSKFILDSEANVALYSFVIEHLESHLKKDVRLLHYLRENHPEGMNFSCMLNYKTMRLFREQVFSRISKQILAITLEKDSVVPCYEVINTLQGVNRNIPVRVEIFDFSYPYKHEDPFPVNPNIKDLVNESFNQVFDLIGQFLK